MPTILGIIPGMESFTSWMMKGQMEKLDVPPVSEFLDLITAGGGTIYACKMTVDMFKMTMEDFCEQVSGIITVGEFYEHAAGEGSHIIFT
jgi:peroxiredoxin family protein